MSDNRGARIRITTIQGDYDVLIGKRWQRGFDRRWKAQLYVLYLKVKRRYFRGQ